MTFYLHMHYKSSTFCAACPKIPLLHNIMYSVYVKYLYSLSVIMYILSNIYSISIVRLPTLSRLAMYRFKIVSYFYCCMFIFMFNYVAQWSCEARYFVPLYVHTYSGMTIKLELTWLIYIAAILRIFHQGILCIRCWYIQMLTF